MPYTTTDHHWLQIKRSAYSALTDLINQNEIVPCSANLCGPTENLTYRLNAGSRFRIINDELLTINRQEIAAELNHQPTIAYRAMVLASPDFEQYPNIDPLLKNLRQNPSNWNPDTFVTALEKLVRVGRQTDTQPRLVTLPKTYKSIWQPQETYFRQTLHGDWMMSLTYLSRYRAGQMAQQKVDVGLDVGLNPVAYAYAANGMTQEFKITPLNHLTIIKNLPLNLEAQNLLQHLSYACGRLDTETVVAWLNYYANRVFSEKLTLDDMDKNYIFRARQHAIHDYHYSSLSQYLNTSQHVFKRVSSHYTSTYCPECREKEQMLVKGVRDGDLYSCSRCGYTANAHEVGARNVLLNGLKKFGNK